MRPLPIVEKGGVLIIKLDDGATLNEGQAAGIRESLYSKLSSTPTPRVALDLSSVDFISSTGIALLIGTKRRVEAEGGQLVLFGLRNEVLELFGIMKLANLFEIADDEAGALALFPPSPSA